MIAVDQTLLPIPTGDHSIKYLLVAVFSTAEIFSVFVISSELSV